MQARTDELRLLAQVGFWGASRGHATAARAIFSAIEAQRPNALAAFVGPAMVDLALGDTLQAIACLERAEAVVSDADKPDLYAFLGLAYQADGQNTRSEQFLRQAGDVPLARALLSRVPARALRAA